METNNLLKTAISQIATNPQNALQIFQQILAENSQQPDALHGIGVLLFNDKQFAKSAEFLQKAIFALQNQQILTPNLCKILSAWLIELAQNEVNLISQNPNLWHQSAFHLMQSKIFAKNLLFQNLFHENFDFLFENESGNFWQKYFDEKSNNFEAIKSWLNNAENLYETSQRLAEPLSCVILALFLNRHTPPHSKSENTNTTLYKRIFTDCAYTFLAYLAINSADKNKKEITKNYLNLVENLQNLQNMQNFSENEDFFKHFQAMYFRLQAAIAENIKHKKSFFEQAEIAEKHYKNLLILAQISAEEKNFEKAEDFCKQAETRIKNNAEKSVIFSIQAIILLQQNKFNEAKNLAQQATKLKNNLKISWKILQNIAALTDDNSLAILACQNLLKLDPFDESAYVNCGERLRRSRQIANAIEISKKGLEFFPESANLWANLGTLMQENHNDEAAKKCYETALSFNANIPQVLNNLSQLYQNAHDNVKARDTLRKSYDLMIAKNIPDKNAFTEITLNLARLESTLQNYEQAVNLIEKLLQLPNISQKQELSAKGQLFGALKSLQESENENFPREKQIFLQNLKQEIQQNILLEVKKQNENINSNSHNFPENIQTVLQRLEKNITALISLRRVGSIFLHSLIDFHPQISTLPSVYFKGFFAADLWARLYPPAENQQCINNNWREHFIWQFCQMYAVFFDARNPQEVPGAPMHRGGNLGEKSGTAKMGENRNEFLSVDKNLFCQNLLNLFNYCQSLSPKLAFLLIHIAFEQTLGRNIENLQAIFYHIHNPDADEYSHFVANFPQAKILLMMREPLKKLDSKLSGAFPQVKKQSGEILNLKGFDVLQDMQNANIPRETFLNFCQKLYKDFASEIIAAMENATNSILFREKFLHETLALVCLENVKQTPKLTMTKIAELIGVDDVENENLLKSTFQGKLFHSPSSSVSPTISGFDQSNLQRKNLIITDENDIKFFNNIFYPLRKFCGYIKNANDEIGSAKLTDLLENNLQWLAKNELFGFEKRLADFIGENQRLQDFAEFDLIRKSIKTTIKRLQKYLQNPSEVEIIKI